MPAVISRRRSDNIGGSLRHFARRIKVLRPLSPQHCLTSVKGRVIDKDSAKEVPAMALSKDDQRTLDEMERALLEDDPKLASTVNFDRHRRHRSVVSGSILLIGVALLLVGELLSQLQLALGVIVGVTGFLVMFAAFALPAHRSNRNRSARPR
jgi:hypothetical protein